MKRDFLSRMGVVGWEEIEPYLLAGLVLREPVLLVGAPGTGKTFVAIALGKALGLNYHVYDASKGMFEDIIGFPDYSDGKVRYVPTELSIWERELIFVDEISRASPEMQNKWLEIIRSRSVMGIPVKTLKYIIGGMNPPGYLGVVGIDLALVDRFAWIIRVPNSLDFEKEKLRDVISTITFMDHLGSETGEDVQKMEELVSFLKEAEDALKKLVNSDIDKKVQDFLIEFPLLVQGTPFEELINNRRLSMMRRCILSYIAVSGLKDIQDIKDTVFKLLPYILPWYAVKIEPIEDYIAVLKERLDPYFEFNTYLKTASLTEMYNKFWEGHTYVLPFLLEKIKKILIEERDDEQNGALMAIAAQMLLELQKRKNELLQMLPPEKIKLIDNLFIDITKDASFEWWEGREVNVKGFPRVKELLKQIVA